MRWIAVQAAALGIYLASCGLETPDPALGERHTVGRNQLLLTKGRYYLVITSPEARFDPEPRLRK